MMYKLKISWTADQFVIVRLSNKRPYSETIFEAAKPHNPLPSGEKRLVFVSDMTVQTIYDICGAVQNVFGDSLVWDVELTPQQSAQSHEADVYLFWSDVGSPK